MPFRSLLAFFFLASAAHAQFTIEQALSSAFPWEIASAPRANRVAWVVSGNGDWNVWLAEGPAYQGRPATAFQGGDGQEISELAWSGNGERLLFTRGSGGGRSGESPNPNSNVNGAEQAVWLLEWNGAAPRRLGEGRTPLFTPDGKRALWLRGGNVWSADLTSDAKPAILFRARGSASDLALSPDGALLAFTSTRSDHSFIGVYSFSAKVITWLDPSTDKDALPAWSPDGKSIAFLRILSERTSLPHGARRSGSPWSLRVADAATGAAREVFRAEPGPGSVFQPVAAGPSLLWAANGFLVFPWEKTNWKLLYAVPAAGGPARLLTPGEFEVEFVEPAPDRNSLIVASNQGDIDRRHLWRVSIDKSSVSPITRGNGIEWAPASLSDGNLALLRSDARQPARAAILSANGAFRDLAPELIPAGFPSSQFVVPQAVKYSAPDGLEIPAQLFLPPGIKPGERRPAIVFIHGGSRRQMLLGWSPMFYYHNAYGFNQYLASRGYVVLSINYRSGTGYGMAFREALNYGPTGASEFQDVLGAGLYLRSRPDVLPNQIGLWGGSWGGYLTALGLARASGLFAAGVDLHGVHEWVRDIQDTRPGAAQLKEDYLRRAWDSSPMSSLDGWKSPVLFIHGDDDRSVIFNQTVQLVEELRKRNVDYELLVFPDEVHDFLLQKNWLRAYQAAASFFDRKLKP